MNEIPFPSWVHRSPVFAMARVLGRQLQEQLLASPTRVSSLAGSHREDSEIRQMTSLFYTKCVDSMSSFNFDEHSAGVMFSGGVKTLGAITSPAATDLRLDSAKSLSQSCDILNHPRVALLIELSQVNELMSHGTSVSTKNAPALISLMALAVECRSLPSDHTKGFYTECASFYTSLMQRLKTMTFLPGVDVQGLVASLVSCGLQLRSNDEEVGGSGGGDGGCGTGRNSNTGISSNRRVKNVGLAGFDSRVIDSIIVSCIPASFDDCVENSIALGTLEGLAYTTKKKSVYLSSQLVNHLHNLTDAFTTLPRRKEPEYKKLQCYLMEAICCARCVEYTRMHNWLAVILERNYLLKGLLQKEDLHARVVAAMLTLLTRWLQDAAKVCISKTKRTGGGDNHRDAAAFAVREESIEADALIENVWTALHEAIVTWEGLQKTNITVYGDNVRIVVENLLRAEMERVQCYRVLSGVQCHTGVVQQQGDTSHLSYVPSAEEEDLRLRVIGNIVKFLLLPTSVFGAISVRAVTATAASLRQDVSEQCAKVIALTAATSGSITSLGRSTTTSSAAVILASFSNKFYNGIESIAHTLILRVLEAGSLSASTSLNAEEGEEEIRIAALCMQSLCATNAHIRSFAVTEVLDAVVRFPSMQHATDASRTSDSSMTLFSTVPVSRMSVCFEMMSRVLASRHRSILRPIPYEGLLRFGQLLCDTFEDTLRSHVSAGDFTDPTVTLPSPTMHVVANSFWRLVKRCHERIRVMTRQSLRLVTSDCEESKVRLIDALNEESKVLHLLLRAVLRCMISVAWPGSGILYGASRKKVNRRPSNFDVTEAALAVLSLFFRPLCLLCQLSTLFPVTKDMRRLMHHHENAQRLMQMDGSDSFLHHYCFHPSNANSPFYADNGTAQFRSCWLMLSYYRFTNEALMMTHSGEVRAGANGRGRHGKFFLTAYQARCIRLLAASMPPLMHMRSSDYQQAMADIEVLGRCLSRSGVISEAKSYEKELWHSLRYCCPEIGHGRGRLSFSELFLVNALAMLEMLRASCGSISTITQYQHFEVREFDASKDVRTIVEGITAAVTTRYLSALQSMPPEVAASRIDENARQLVMLYGFAIDSVRRSAKDILTTIINIFPAPSSNSGALPLLWAVINLLESGNSKEIERFCEHLRFPETPAVATDPDSLERRKQLQDVVAFAEFWAAVARRRTPLALQEHATLFVVETEGPSGVLGSGAGSQLAIRAQSVNTASPDSSPNYAQGLIKRSNAQGQMMAASRLFPRGGIENLFLERLKAMVEDGLETRGVAAQSQEKVFASLLNTVRAVATLGERAEDEDEDEHHHHQQKTSHRGRSPIRAGQAELQKLYEADTLLCTVAAFLTSPHISPSARMELLRYLVQGPIHLFTSHYIKAAIQGWNWLLFEKREWYAVPLLVQVVEGFLWTISQRIGLFDGARPSQSDEVESGDRTASMQSTTIYPDDYNTNSPHKVLIGFITSCYVDLAGPVTFDPSILLLLHRLAMRVVESPSRFSTKDASFSETMRCALMVSYICRNLQMANGRRLNVGLPVLVASTSIGALHQGLYKCLLQWFRKTPPSWYFSRDPSAAEEELTALGKLIGVLDADKESLSRSVHGFLDFSGFGNDVCSASKLTIMGNMVCQGASVGSGSVRGVGSGGIKDVDECIAEERDRLMNLIGLLRLLVEHERTRLMVWLRPREAFQNTQNHKEVSEVLWKAHCEAAARNDPAVLLALVTRFPNAHVLGFATQLVSENPEVFCHIPEAVDLYLNDAVLMNGYPALYMFTNCGIVQALRFLDRRYTSRYPQVSAYALRSLLSQKSESLIFYLPQILQVLSGDQTDGIATFLRKMCGKSEMFTHQLLWSLRTEGGGEGELAKKCMQLASEIQQGFDAHRRAFLDGEFSFIQRIISVSGEMKPVEKAQRKERLRIRLRDAEFHEPMGRLHLYLPTDVNWRIVGLIPHTAGAMQSAAKCPILVQFQCVPRGHDDTEVAPKKSKSGSLPKQTESVVKACIFKMGDDCRQDQIALQLIGLFQSIFNAIQVPSYLYPYRVVTTGKDCGIIECVPRAMSRDQIGKLVESNLAEYFVQTYGHPESVTFHRARDCFIRSMSSYSVASFILNIKDRHNGNIMIDAHGHLVHIDFGFLFDLSPGGDINFESSPFKLTAEMVQLMGHPVKKRAGTVQSPSLAKALVNPEGYDLFVDLTVRCYLAVRQYARQICILVELMLSSGLPCFKPQRTIQDLAWRLSMQKSEAEAADFILKRIAESKENLRTFLYDRYQNIAEGIEM
ncbi:putative phosphatidylinositol 4-kinase alpha [Trypanosoma grayi]|uniref:putative phosphatidylinositol 4-kinase alpha n=1 Tax=Trypanosoma grayi TaxID=71804 RepID=UPI0004F451F7|nr:putative phosphatidylinositol 4-kinase alpha [Trypanosoma grayi]KEG09771.1 putative phosphatidylinositol 4-kinase alpha [Trypanosoma grayi]